VISIIVAMSENRVIGNDNTLIWKLPADLKRFKEITTGNTIVMGRKTYESIGRPLPNRRNIIITRDKNYKAEGCEVVNSIEESLLTCGDNIFIIGGGEIYKQSIGISDKIYLTLIHETFEGDTIFSELGDEWKEINREDHDSDEKNKHKYSFIEYEKYKF
jgi:dihydrofolate reductase